MNEIAPQRLVWRRSGPNGFIAFPMGENWRDVQATLVRGATQNRGGDAWHWVVRFETWARAAGMSVYRRLAVEAANVAWPVVRAEGEAARSAAMLRQRLLLTIDKVERRNVVTIEDFGLSDLDHQALLFVVRECRGRWERRYMVGKECRAVEALMNATSEELFRRRTGVVEPV